MYASYSTCHLFFFVLVVLGLAGTSNDSFAQRWLDTNKPVTPGYGYRLNEFPIIASPTKWTGDSINSPGFAYGNIWNFAHAMRFNVCQVDLGPFDANILDAIVHTPITLRRRGQDNKPELDTDRIILVQSALRNAGYGREIQFYPFDSVQSPFFVWKFAQISGGTTELNEAEADLQLGPPSEQVYHGSTTTPGDTIAWNITYENPDDPVDSRHFFDRRVVELRDANTQAARRYYFVTTAHLFDSLNSANGDATPVFRIELRHSIASGMHYLLDDMTTAQAASDMSILIDTFSVTKGELLAGTDDRPKYRRSTRAINLRLRPVDGGPGPMNAAQPGDNDRRVEALIFWTGAEMAALRSFAIRDSIGHMMISDTASAVSYRDALLVTERRLLRGDGATGTNLDSLRHCIIAQEVTSEPNWNPFEFAGFKAAGKLLADTFNLAHYRQANSEPIRVGDSLRGWTSHGGSSPDVPGTFHRLSGAREIYPQFGYLNSLADTVPAFRDSTNYDVFRTATGIPLHQIPTLVEHNGGRFHLPILDSTADAVELYETTLQRGFLGFYHPGGYALPWPYNKNPGSIDFLGESASIAKREGLRLMPVVGTTSAFVIRKHPDSSATDTIASHIPEVSELRMLAHMALCYGGSGLWWWNLQTNPQEMRETSTGSGIWVTPPANALGENCCWGPSGFLNRDTVPPPGTSAVNDAADRFNFRLFDIGGTEQGVILNYYAGWRARTREIKRIDSALLGPDGVVSELIKLRWRDGYSISHTVRWPGATTDTLFRTLPSTEIITGVTSRYPGGSTIDSAHRTFVELGFFHTRPGFTATGDTAVMFDTNYVYVVNRRTMARPPEIPADSPRGLRLDTLAETREIRLRFHLHHSIEDTTRFKQYSFIRVQEVLPDRTPLPLSNQPRHVLDTLIYGDSTAVVVLPPGSGTLLRVTFDTMDVSLDSGNIRFNSQRKMVFDGVHYHATYWRTGYDVANNRWDDTVYYRRSMRVDSIAGPIRWQSFEHPISNTHAAGDTTRYQNRYPSITYSIVDNGTNGVDTVLFIVWTCHVTDTSTVPNRREIVMRAINVDGPTIDASDYGPMEKVDMIFPDVPTQFGTPVISSLRGGEALAWSDSVRGILVRTRHHATGANWWQTRGTYSPIVRIDSTYTQSTLPGQYPSLPTFAHPIADTACAIVWQQRMSPGVNNILYSRLFDRGTATPVWVAAPIAMNGAGTKGHPSIDGALDSGVFIREGVTWEEFRNQGATQNNWVYYRSVSSPITVTGSGIIISAPTTGSSLSTLIHGDASLSDSAYPNVASLNMRLGYSTRTDSTSFSVVCQTEDGAQYQLRIPYDSVHRRTTSAYAFYGHTPTLSASRMRHDDRDATLYNAYNPNTGADDLLRTSRQFFFAKARPRGYFAEGREATIRLVDSMHAAITVMMLDPWASDATSAMPLRMTRQGSVVDRVDSLPQVNSLLRTESFHASDSTTVGVEVHMEMQGDTSALGDARFDLLVELVDSATGQPVAVLDSFRFDSHASKLDTVIDTDVDLVTGSYFIRTRIDAMSYVPVDVVFDGRFIATELMKYVDEAPLGRVRRLAGSSAPDARISAQPNPFDRVTEVRFSIAANSEVSVRVFDDVGREVARLIDRHRLDAGRYAVDFDAHGIPHGVYFVELDYGGGRVVEKVVLAQ